jgi:hypothetical protein
MNSVNPIKNSHEEDLQWLFRTLNLLPRTIFVLSRFDEVADVEDEKAYQEAVLIKKENVLHRLKDLINLSDKESSELSIIAVSANPFEMGMDHWLSEIDKFKQLSHISLLQNATSQKIKNNGGIAVIANETKKSIIQDVLTKQMPISKELNKQIAQEVRKLTDISQIMHKDIKSLEPKISEIRIHLREFASEHFSDLILKVKGTSLETIGTFIEKEIGSEGIVLNTKIQNEFERQIGTVSFELEKIKTNFNAEINTFNDTIKTYGKQGVTYLSKSGFFNKDNVLAARDVIASGAKTLGLDLSKYLKFKPWGATKLANGATGFLAVIGLGLELWDSYEKSEQERKFREAVAEMVSDFEKQRKEMIDLLNGDDFIIKFFPNYVELKKNLQNIEDNISEMDKQQQSFEEWVKTGEAIDVEFFEIKQLT